LYLKQHLLHDIVVGFHLKVMAQGLVHGTRAPTTLKSEGEVTSLSGADKREVRDNREKW
jgi:hypothetical protein